MVTNALILNETIKGVIFDLDGTLADTMPLHYIAWEEVAQSYGFHFPETLFYELAGVPTLEIIQILNQKFGKEMEPETVHAEKENAFLKRLHTVKPVQPVLSFALEIFEKGVPMAVGTGGVPDVAYLTLEAIGAQHLFRHIVTSKDVMRFKPEPDTFLLCAERMGVAAEDCLVLEDSHLGIEAAKRAGMHFIDVREFY